MHVMHARTFAMSYTVFVISKPLSRSVFQRHYRTTLYGSRASSPVAVKEVPFVVRDIPTQHQVTAHALVIDVPPDHLGDVLSARIVHQVLSVLLRGLKTNVCVLIRTDRVLKLRGVVPLHTERVHERLKPTTVTVVQFPCAVPLVTPRRELFAQLPHLNARVDVVLIPHGGQEDAHLAGVGPSGENEDVVKGERHGSNLFRLFVCLKHKTLERSTSSLYDVTYITQTSYTKPLSYHIQIHYRV